MNTRAALPLVVWLTAAFHARADEEVVRRWTFDAAEDAAGWVAAQQINDMRVQGGTLRMQLAGTDAYLYVPPVETPLDGCTVRIRIRAEQDGWTQVYWQTGDDPVFSERQVMGLHTPGSLPGGDAGFITLDFPIGTPADAGRTLTALRIDPSNGPGSGLVEIDSVEVSRGTPLHEYRFAPNRQIVDIGEPVRTGLTVLHVGGRAATESLTVTLSGTPHMLAVTTRPVEVNEELRFDRPGVHVLQASVAYRDAPEEIIASSLIVGRRDRLPLVTALRSSRVRLDFVQAADGKRIGGARWMISHATNQYTLAGWLLPLCELAFRDYDGRTIHLHPAMTIVEQGPSSVLLRGVVEKPQRWQVEVRFDLRERDDIPYLQVTASLQPPDGGQLVEFAGPTLLVDRDPPRDPLDRHALFGGLEFLEPGWPSSSDRAVGGRFADRWTPHPFKITLPMMAVESADITTAMLWQPLDKWDAVRCMPAATFASPNFLSGQPNHLMKLSVPGILEGRIENTSVMREPMPTRASSPLTLRSVLFTEVQFPLAHACRVWYDIFEAPPQPPPTHSDRRLYDIVARNYGETMYWADEKGWRHHWWHTETSSTYIPFMAGTLVAHAADTGETRWVERTGLAGRSVIDASGTLAARLGGDAHARACISSMRPDGTWPFVNTPQMREQTRQFTQGKYDSLGEDGSTSLGTCVQNALPILRYAHLSGDAACIAAGVKALEAMRRFRVPRGAQVWEVHQEIPDMRAATLAVEAYRLGFELTGEPAWLDDASYWAYTGLPFIYSWHLPAERSPGRLLASRNRSDPRRITLPLSEACGSGERQIMPFATVPVLGPTFYVINWFGVVVQWVGLEWAAEVIRMEAIRSDPLLRYIADGVVASGLQQTFDKPPWVGLYPDVWDPQTNTAQGAFISAMLPMRCLEAQGHIPAWSTPWTCVLRPAPGEDTAGLVWHVSGWGRPVELDVPRAAVPWNARIEFLPGQPTELLMGGIAEPRRVLISGETLQQVTGQRDDAARGWRYDAARRAMLARFAQEAGTVAVRVEW